MSNAEVREVCGIGVGIGGGPISTFTLNVDVSWKRTMTESETKPFAPVRDKLGCDDGDNSSSIDHRAKRRESNNCSSVLFELSSEGKLGEGHIE